MRKPVPLLDDDKPLDVERACSGLRMFYGIFALAFACIALARPARWKAILVLLAAGPIAIVANVLRIVTTGILMKKLSVPIPSPESLPVPAHCVSTTPAAVRSMSVAPVQASIARKCRLTTA
jgi:exosortase/archaeosortase family protein